MVGAAAALVLLAANRPAADYVPFDPKAAQKSEMVEVAMLAVTTCVRDTIRFYLNAGEHSRDRLSVLASAKCYLPLVGARLMEPKEAQLGVRAMAYRLVPEVAREGQ